MDADPQRWRRQQPAGPPKDYQPSGPAPLRGRQTSSPDVTHDLEWDPQVADRNDPAPERPGAGAPLQPVKALGIDPGPPEPGQKDDDCRRQTDRGNDHQRPGAG